jgi:predicted SnoaL-like aldol condensation-catalyzing enzyme
LVPDYIQRSAHIAPGREGLFNLIKSIPPTLKYEPGTIVADGDFVIVHGLFSGFGQPVNWIAADILRIKGGQPATVKKQTAHVRGKVSDVSQNSRVSHQTDNFPSSSSDRRASRW